MNIGPLMTYNEADVLEEVLAANAPHVDTILALDGSDDGTTELLRAHPKVELLLRDEEVASGPVRDYHRQCLLEAAQDRYGYEHWFTLLHGDEIFYDDPKRIIAAAEREGAKRVNWAVMQFFLHPEDATASAADTPRPVQERIRWYSPFWVEVRQFRGTRRSAYRWGRHGCVVPDGVGWQPYSRMPILKHYPYRSAAQMARRLRQTAARGFSGTPSGNYDATDIFRSRYAPEYRLARRFEGDFGELELARQGGLLPMIWRWKRWVR